MPSSCRHVGTRRPPGWLRCSFKRSRAWPCGSRAARAADRRRRARAGQRRTETHAGLALAPQPFTIKLALSRRKQGFESLGSANDFSNLAPKRRPVWPASPTFLQWTVLQTIGSRSRCARRLEEVESDLRGHRRAGLGANLTIPTLASRRSPWSKLNMRANCLAFAHVDGFTAG